MKKNKFTLLCLAAVLSSLVASGCSKRTGAAEKSVRIAIQPSAAFIPLYSVRYSGILEKELAPKKINVIWQDFESGPPMNESLAAELTDIGVIGDVPSVRALTNDKKMKIVGVPARGPNAYAVLAEKKDTSINCFADLKGKRVATVFGSTGHNFTKKLLEANGMTFADIDFLNITAVSAEEILLSDVADAVVIWEPNVTRLVDRGLAKIVAQGEQTDLRGTNAFIVREDYLEKNYDVISAILEAYDEAAVNLENLQPEIRGKIASVLKISEKQLMQIAKKYDFSCAVTKDDVKSLQNTVEFLVSIKNLDKSFDVESYVDRSCLKKE